MPVTWIFASMECSIHCKWCSFIHNWQDDQLNMVGQWLGCESHPMVCVPMKQHSSVRYQNNHFVFVIDSLFKRMMCCCIICVYRLALPSTNAVSTLSRSKCHINRLDCPTKQDHRRWKYHSRLNDSPYFQLQFPLDHRRPENHRIPLDHQTSYFHLKLLSDYWWFRDHERPIFQEKLLNWWHVTGSPIKYFNECISWTYSSSRSIGYITTHWESFLLLRFSGGFLTFKQLQTTGWVF